MRQYLINIYYIGTLSLLLGLAGCTDEATGTDDVKRQVMTFDIQHPSSTKTRMTDTSFESGDQVGIFLTVSGHAVDIAGNYLTNIPLTFDGTEWGARSPLYWDEGQYDAYAYYPYLSPLPSVTDLPFSIQTDQSTTTGYAASDFLWAQKKAITGSDGEVSLTFSHRMSRLMVRLVKGDDYEGDLPDDAEVFIHNTITDATIDLNAGIATHISHASPNTIHAHSIGNHRYTAIVVPQRLDNRQPLVEVVTNGVSYLYEGKFLFKPGVQHNILLALSQNASQVKIQIGGETENWNE